MEFVFIGGIITGLLMAVMCVYIGGHSKNDGSNKGEFTDNCISSINDVNGSRNRSDNNRRPKQIKLDPDDAIDVIKQIIFDCNLSGHEVDVLEGLCDVIDEGDLL